MGIVQRKSAVVSILMLIGVGLAYLNITILFPKYLSESQIGILRVIISGPSILMPLVVLGVNAIAIRYYPKVKDDKELFQKFYSFGITLPLISSAIIGAVLALNYTWFADKLGFTKEAVAYSWMLIPMTMLLAYNLFYTSVLNNLMKQEVTNFFANIWYRIIQLLAVVLFVLDVISFAQLVACSILIYVLQLIIVVIIFQRNTGLKFIPNLLFVKSNLFRESSVYGLFSTLNAGGAFIVQNVDVVMTSSLISLKATGVYSTSFFIAIIIELPRRAINQSIIPLLSQDIKEKAWVAVKEKYRLTSINQFMIGGMLFLMLWLNIDFVYELMPNGEKYASGKYVILFIGLAKAYDMFWGVNGEILGLSKHYKWNTWLIIFLVALSITTNFILIPRFNIIGTAMATFATIFVINTLRGILVWQKLKMLPFTWSHLKLIAIFVVVYFSIQWIPVLDNTFINIGLRTIAICILGGGLILLTKSSTQLNQMLSKVFGRGKA